MSIIERQVERIARIRNFAKRESRGDNQPKDYILTDESNPQGIRILRPLKSAGYWQSEIKKELEFLSQTRSLEVGTERTEALQAIVDKMAEGADVQARVVIMSKGAETQAFAMPDGSIFLSQSLINELDSLDEVAGVLAHELGHIINKTSEKKRQADRGKRLGVGWIHEAASDSLAPVLLEKVGLNTFGFVTAIQKISHDHRGVEHQSGYSRASQNVGMHIGIDFKTSSQANTPMPDSLRTEQVKRANLEIMIEAIKGRNQKLIEGGLSLLHPRDLASAYERATHQVEKFGQEEVKPEHMQVLQTFHSFFTDKLSVAGFRERATNIFFLLTQNSSMNPTDFSMISAPEVLIQAVGDFLTVIDNKYFDKMHEVLFGQRTMFETYDEGLLDRLLRNLQWHLYDVGHSSEPYKIPVTADSLLTVLSKIDQIPYKYGYWSGFGDSKEGMFAEILREYVRKVYFGGKYGTEIQNQDEIKAFLGKAKAAGIPVDYREVGQYSSDYMKELKRIFEEVFAEKPKGLDDQIDAFFAQFVKTQESYSYGQARLLGNFLKDFRELLKEQKVPDSERLKLVEHFAAKVKQLNLASEADFEGELSLGLNEEVDRQEFYKKLRAFNLNIIGALAIFEADGAEFYQYLTNYFNNCGIKHTDLSLAGLINISHDLLNANNYTGFKLYTSEDSKGHAVDSGKVEISHYDQFLQLPFLRDIVEQSKNHPRFSTLGELNGYLEELHGHIVAYKVQEIYSDSLLSIILGEITRNNALELLQQGVREEEYGELYTFIDRYYPNGPQTTRFLRELKRIFLHSSEVSLQDKIAYLIKNFDDIGPDGMVTVAEQITSLEDYKYFRERIKDQLTLYLEGGSTRPSDIAVLDVVTAKFVKKFDLLIKSTKTDPKTKREVNTDLAKVWVKAYFGSWNRSVNYDKKTEKVVLDAKGRQSFRTLADSIESFRNLSPFQRFAIAHKALVDKDGALTGEENRKLLGQVLVESLGLRGGFIASALRYGCETASADFFSFPAAQMLAPLLFRGFDVNAVDMKEFRYEYRLPAEHLPRLMRSTTRNVTVFGIGYPNDPTSYIAKLATESDQDYVETTKILEAMFPGRINGEKRENHERVNAATEAVIKAVEASGALGVRSLQLARQLYHFSPTVDRRLSQAFDARPGLNKLLFWENLTKLADQDETGVLKDFVQTRLISLDDMLGGGSLYTTFAARIRDEEGQVVDGVIKLLNPNPTLFIGTTYDATKRVFGLIEEHGSEQDKRFARMGEIFIDLSQQWCLRDINDPTFVEDDNTFQHTVDAFNRKRDSETFYMPDRLVTTYKLKSEERAEGQTLNKVLSDATVSPAIKKRLVQEVADFFVHQLETVSGVDADGNTYRLVHSDPHIGNYVVDIAGESPRIGVIDRSMYLRLSEQDAELFAGLMRSGSYRSFVGPFIDRVMDHNKVINDSVRSSTKRRIINALTYEYVKQGFESVRKLRLQVDNFAVLRRMLDEFSKAGLDIPLEMRLMVRNIEAFKELKRRYKA